MSNLDDLVLVALLCLVAFSTFVGYKFGYTDGCSDTLLDIDDQMFGPNGTIRELFEDKRLW